MRPDNRRDFGDGMKLHLRVLRLAGREYRVITLRPGTDARFSTNYFHDTWHILSDIPGTRLLGRLLWGLAYQKLSNTLIVIHGEHLKPTPFEAEPSLPILLLPAHLTHPDADAFRELKQSLSHPCAPTRTIRWHTFGMTEYEAHPEFHQERTPTDRSTERMALCGGFLCYCALPRMLRQQGNAIHRITCHTYDDYDPQSYHYLAEQRPPQTYWHAEGEVQVFAHYREKLAIAAQAKREVEERGIECAGHLGRTEEIWERTFAIRKQRRVARKAREQKSRPLSG